LQLFSFGTRDKPDEMVLSDTLKYQRKEFIQSTASDIGATRTKTWMEIASLSDPRRRLVYCGFNL